MNELSEYILSSFQRRKSYDEKSRFIGLIRERYPEIRIEEKRKTRNIVFGDPETAEYVFTGHYDTCAVLLFPNLVFANNILITVLAAFAVCLPMFIAEAVINILLAYLGAGLPLIMFSIYAIMIVFIWWVYAGPASSHTANDNTSGTLAVLELYDRMPSEMKSRCAFVLFDNEEKGLIGSRNFLSQHKDASKRFTLINFDCVSDGDDIMFVFPKTLRQEKQRFEESYGMPGKRAVLRSASNTMYPSDQKGFPKGIAVAAMHHCVFGYYVPRIHTRRDVIFDRKNIDFICDGTIKLLQR